MVAITLPPSHLILCEGVHDKAFLGAIAKHLNRQSDFTIYMTKDVTGHGGSGQWKQALNSCLVAPGFQAVRSVTLFGDSDDDPNLAFRLLCDAVRRSSSVTLQGVPYKLDPPAASRVLSTSSIPVRIFLVPTENDIGELATLIERAIRNLHPNIAACVDAFVNCINPQGLSPGKLAKLRVTVSIAELCRDDPSTKIHQIWLRTNPVIPITTAAFQDALNFLSSYP